MSGTVFKTTIRSVDRTSGTSSRFQMIFAKNIIKIKKIELLSINMFNTFYNVVAGYNTRLVSQ
jgi:hypothetical protein